MDIKKKIQQHGMTLAALAKEMGISSPTLHSIINNDNPKFASLQKIADALKISVSELVKDDGEPTSITCPLCGQEIVLEPKLKSSSE